MIYYGSTTGSGNFGRTSSVVSIGSKLGAYVAPRTDNIDSTLRYNNAQSMNGRLDNYASDFYSVRASGRSTIYDITTQGAASSGSIRGMLAINRGADGYLFIDQKDLYTSNIASAGLFLASGESVELKGPIAFVGCSGFTALDFSCQFTFNPNLV